MESLTFEIESNSEILSLLDQSVKHFFVHQFNPHPVLNWFNAGITLDNSFELKNAQVRSLAFDLQTDWEGIKQILELNTNQLTIYQFDKKIPDALILENLPIESRNSILKKNGLKHVFWIDFECISVESFDKAFIKSISENPLFEERIRKRINLIQQNRP